MGEVFIASAAAAVRRQVDNDTRSVCLRRLLQEALDYSKIVTRNFYRSLCDPTGTAEEWHKELIDHAFDEWAGRGGNHVDPAVVEADLMSLLDTCRRIRHYANKRVAHWDKDGITPGMMPTFQDLDEAYRVIEALIQKYHLMFTGIWVGQVRPTIVYPWKDIFTVPWLTSK